MNTDIQFKFNKMKLKKHIKKREGIGSLFHDIEISNYHFNNIKIGFDCELFYTGIQSQLIMTLKKYGCRIIIASM